MKSYSIDSIKDSSKSCPAPPFPAECAGTDQFSNLRLVLAWILVPLLITAMSPAILTYSWYWLPFIALATALPTFAAFNILHCLTVKTPTCNTKLPGKSIDEYMTFNDQTLRSTYANSTKKIPMETWFEAYFDQKIDIKGDMLETLERRYDWARFVFTLNQAKFFLTQWVPETLWHSRKQDEDQVRDHYDRGDDFYNAFLGPMMIYTSGIMHDASSFETLEQLQQHKLDLVTKKIQLKSNEKMLDIGCGWGTLSVHAAKMGASVTGVTLGRNQAEWGMRQAAEANVTDKVNILCMDYRDIPATEKYDKITCLEMAEHVGVLRFQTFLQQVKGMLKDDGMFFLQIAGLRRAWQYEDLTWGLFMAKYVFPGADASPPLNWVIEQLERAGFEVAHTDTIGVHYAATIYRWYLNWMKNKDEICEKYGVVWFRRWEVFLAWSTIIARQGSATCYQITCHKNRNAFDRTTFVADGRLKA